MRTAQEIVDQTNALANKLYALRGYIERPGFRFDLATHPHEVEAWEGACAAQLMLTDTDPMDAIAELEDVEDVGEPTEADTIFNKPNTWFEYLDVVGNGEKSIFDLSQLDVAVCTADEWHRYIESGKTVELMYEGGDDGLKEAAEVIEIVKCINYGIEVSGDPRSAVIIIKRVVN